MRKLLASVVVLASVLAQGVAVGVRASAGAAQVQIVGDSITQLAAGDLRHDLEETGLVRYDIHVSGRGGTTLAENLPVVWAGLGRGWDWVVELGTNDALGRNPHWQHDLGAMVDALQGERCAVFVTVGTQLPRGAVIARDIDLALYRATVTHSNLHLAGWGDLQYRDRTWLRQDGIHPSLSGAAELAELVHRTLNRACQP